MVKKLLTLVLSGVILAGAVDAMAKGPYGSQAQGQGQRKIGQPIQQQDQLMNKNREQKRQRIRNPQTHVQPRAIPQNINPQ